MVNPRDQKDSISLNKFISSTGRCSRREADKLIEAKRVTINNRIAKKGNRVNTGDTVAIDGDSINAEVSKPVYIAFNKPVGIVCTTDRKERDNIVDFIGHEERLFPIGRLDKDSQGLIFLTNDGDIVNKILRADNQHEKEYIVQVKQAITLAFIKQMSQGVSILGKMTSKCKVKQITKYTFSIILTQGWNRQIRRMCEALGYDVTQLQRIRVMHVELGKLKQGKWRNLTTGEIEQLREQIRSSSKTAKSFIRAPKSPSRGYNPRLARNKPGNRSGKSSRQNPKSGRKKR